MTAQPSDLTNTLQLMARNACSERLGQQAFIIENVFRLLLPSFPGQVSVGLDVNGDVAEHIPGARSENQQ